METQSIPVFGGVEGLALVSDGELYHADRLLRTHADALVIHADNVQDIKESLRASQIEDIQNMVQAKPPQTIIELTNPYIEEPPLPNFKWPKPPNKGIQIGSYKSPRKWKQSKRGTMNGASQRTNNR